MEGEVGRLALAKATRRLIPYLFGIYCIAYLDRVNVSFAQLQLEDASTSATPFLASGPGSSRSATCCSAAAGILSAIPVFRALPTAFLSGTAAAAGIALIAAVGNLGGFCGPGVHPA